MLKRSACTRLYSIGRSWLFSALQGLMMGALSVTGNTAPSYPANPYLTDKALFLAADGLIRYDRHTLAAHWQVLARSAPDAPVATSAALVVGNSAGLWVVEPQTGALRWRLGAGMRFFSPSVDAGIAYAGTESGLLQALALTSGRVLWQRQFSGWVYPPAISGDILIAAGQAHRVFGLDRHTGELLWQRELAQESVFSPVASIAGLVTVTLFSGDILALSVTDGQLRWQQRDTVANLSPVGAGERLFFRTINGEIKARSARTGQLLWRNQDFLSTQPVFVSGRWLSARDDTGKIAVFDTRDGRLVWQHHSHGVLIGRPVLAGNHLIFFTDGAPVAGPKPTVIRWSTKQY